jgi:hypothetical protein
VDTKIKPKALWYISILLEEVAIVEPVIGEGRETVFEAVFVSKFSDSSW